MQLHQRMPGPQLLPYREPTAAPTIIGNDWIHIYAPPPRSVQKLAIDNKRGNRLLPHLNII